MTERTLAARVVAAPLWAHALALALVLVAVLPIVGTHGQFSADEGAVIDQAQLLADGHGWTTTHPFPAVDPSGEAFPVELSQHRGDQYAPFVKHPLYALVLAGADDVAGRTGMVLVSVVGTWVAAVLTALIARRLDARPSIAVLTLWLTGVASPLFFDAYVLIAHAIGAAFVALAALLLVDVIDRRGHTGVRIAGASLAVFVAVLLRTEALLLAAGLTVGLSWVAWRRRDRAFVLTAAVPLLAGVVAHFVEARWFTSIMGGPSTDTSPFGVASRGGVGGRVLGFIITWLLPSYRLDLGAALTFVSAVLVVVAGVIVLRSPDDDQGPIVFSGTAAALTVVRLVFVPGPVPGLLVAFPFLALAALVLRRAPVANDDRRLLLLTAAAVFAVLVIATQYSVGGSGEWGGRYFAIGLPLVLPFVAVALAELGDRLGSARVRPVAIALAVVVGGLAVLSVRTLAHQHRTNDRLVAAVVDAASHVSAGDGGRPVVISTEGAPGRFAVDDLGRVRWLTVDVNDLDDLGARLRDNHIEGVTIVSRHPDDAAHLAGYRVMNSTVPVDGWYVTTATGPT